MNAKIVINHLKCTFSPQISDTQTNDSTPLKVCFSLVLDLECVKSIRKMPSMGVFSHLLHIELIFIIMFYSLYLIIYNGI